MKNVPVICRELQFWTLPGQLICQILDPRNDEHIGQEFFFPLNFRVSLVQLVLLRITTQQCCQLATIKLSFHFPCGFLFFFFLYHGNSRSLLMIQGSYFISSLQVLVFAECKYLVLVKMSELRERICCLDYSSWFSTHAPARSLCQNWRFYFLLQNDFSNEKAAWRNFLVLLFFPIPVI